jgi:hypothetical protein
MRLPAKLHYAWVVAAVTFVVLLQTAGVRAAPGILIVPLENEFHWARSTISFAVGVGGAAAAYLGGVLRISFGAYLEAFLFAGLLCFAAAAMAVSIGAGGRRAEPARDPVRTA